jgi:myo-inositol 2-dehydrogenase/D-chiro-inositol 1-dehydrogenase
MGALHAATLAGLDHVEEVIVVDADPARAQAAAERLGLEAVADVQALISTRPDGVVICSPSSTHADLIMRAQDARITTFCEKPVATDLFDTQMVADRVADGLVPVFIGFQRRFDKGFTAAQEAVASGSLGWVHTIRANTCDAAPPPPDYIPSSGGFFRDCSIHDFDAIRFVTGREVVSVFALGENRGEAFFAESGDIDAAAAVLTLEDGTLALISGSRYNARGYDVRLEALGSRDSISVGLDERLPLRSVEAGVDFPSEKPYVDFFERFHQAYVDEMVAFTDLVAGRIQTPCSVQDGLKAFLIAEACDLSRRQGRPVQMHEVGQ